MKSIKEKAQEVKTELLLNRANIPEIYEAGANYVIELIESIFEDTDLDVEEAYEKIYATIEQLKK